MNDISFEQFMKEFIELRDQLTALTETVSNISQPKPEETNDTPPTNPTTGGFMDWFNECLGNNKEVNNNAD